MISAGASDARRLRWKSRHRVFCHNQNGQAQGPLWNQEGRLPLGGQGIQYSVFVL